MLKLLKNRLRSAAPLLRGGAAQPVQGQVPGDPAQKYRKHRRSVGRHGAPRPEIGVADALLRVPPVGQDASGDAGAVGTVFFRRSRDGALIPGPKQRHNSGIIHSPLPSFPLAFHFYRHHRGVFLTGTGKNFKKTPGNGFREFLVLIKGKKPRRVRVRRREKLGSFFTATCAWGKIPLSPQVWNFGPKAQNYARSGVQAFWQKKRSFFARNFYPHRAVSMGMICFLRLMTPGRNRVLSLGSTEKALRMASSLPTYSSCVPSSKTSVSISSTMS